MEEILHYLRWLKPCKWWDKPSINWCRIYSIHSISLSNQHGIDMIWYDMISYDMIWYEHVVGSYPEKTYAVLSREEGHSWNFWGDIWALKQLTMYTLENLRRAIFSSWENVSGLWQFLGQWEVETVLPKSFQSLGYSGRWLLPGMTIASDLHSLARG